LAKLKVSITICAYGHNTINFCDTVVVVAVAALFLLFFIFQFSGTKDCAIFDTIHISDLPWVLLYHFVSVCLTIGFWESTFIHS
jgi:hypothetical protein